MRILIIEDEKGIGLLLQAGLKAESYAVDLETDGSQGFMAACVNDYDLVILDNILPGKEGPDICRDLRARGKTMPILMVSVESEVARKAYLLEIGADDYITKPFSFEEVSARVKALLRRPRSLQSSCLQVEDLVLDRDRFKVTRGRRIIELTNKEFDLLEYFMRHSGRVLSRGMILEHVWDRRGDIFSNTIETHVMNLRRKISAPGKKDLIRTITGRGYKMEG